MTSDLTAVPRLADDRFIATDRKDWAAARALFDDGPIDVDTNLWETWGTYRLSALRTVVGWRLV